MGPKIAGGARISSDPAVVHRTHDHKSKEDTAFIRLITDRGEGSIFLVTAS